MPKLKEASLDSVCFLVTDGTHDTPKRVKNGFPLIKAKEIVGGKIDFETCDQISEEEHLRVIARSKPEYGDTLFAHIGASLGEAAFVKVHHAFSIKNIALFKPNLKIIDERYLYYLVISPAFQGLAKQTKTGSAQPFLSLGHLRSHRVTYHEALNEQRKIGAILSTYDDLIENNLQRIKILDGMAQNIFREWFVKFRFPGHQHARFTDSSLGQIPEGWEVKRLGAAFLTLLGGTPSRNNPAFWRNGTIPWINSGKVNDHRVTEPSELITS
jgi:type I restriction enzyme S subunit